jgi:hypothetical protein
MRFIQQAAENLFSVSVNYVTFQCTYVKQAILLTDNFEQDFKNIF